MLDTRSANECVKAGGANKRQTNLFGNMWRTGEVALLFGETGVSKSILAMQIAESIARGLPALSEPGAASAVSSAEPVATGFRHPTEKFLYINSVEWKTENGKRKTTDQLKMKR